MELLTAVKQFLQEFICKLDIWGFYLRQDRTNDKNTKTLLALGVNYSNVRNILKSLQAEDYSEGPITDTLYKISPLWVFGKRVKGQEVYIKVQMGIPSSQTICVSFHLEEHPMKYPLKN